MSGHAGRPVDFECAPTAMVGARLASSLVRRWGIPGPRGPGSCFFSRREVPTDASPTTVGSVSLHLHRIFTGEYGSSSIRSDAKGGERRFLLRVDAEVSTPRIP